MHVCSWSVIFKRIKYNRGKKMDSFEVLTLLSLSSIFEVTRVEDLGDGVITVDYLKGKDLITAVAVSNAEHVGTERHPTLELCVCVWLGGLADEPAAVITMDEDESFEWIADVKSKFKG